MAKIWIEDLLKNYLTNFIRCDIIEFKILNILVCVLAGVFKSGLLSLEFGFGDCFYEYCGCCFFDG